MAIAAALVLVRPDRESADVRSLVTHARKTARHAGVPLAKTFRAQRGTVAGEWFAGPVQFLEPNDAQDLYRRMHRSRVLVLSFTRIYVRRDPSRQPVVRRAALELGEFVDHKAEFALIRTPAELAAALEQFCCRRRVKTDPPLPVEF